MPYTKEQLRTYWQTHKDQLNQKRRHKRRLAKIAAKEVSHLARQVSQITLKRVSHGEVSQKLAKVSRQSLLANPKTANSAKASHGKPIQEMANPILAKLIQKWQTSTNYNCAPNCQTNYCSNCWYFNEGKLVNYKEAAM